MKPIDVLLLQLGTPDGPTARQLRPYLREFLYDPRVIEAPAWKRWLLVNLLIVPVRAGKSAAKYRRIWNEETGSPLLDISRRQTAALADLLGPEFRVRLAMRYGHPSVQNVVEQLGSDRCQRLLVIPMFPQYSATTTASGLDALFGALRDQRVLPAIRTVADYHNHPAYIDAVAAGIEARIREAEQAGLKAEVNLLSFHGIPRDYIERGDPYQAQSRATAGFIAQRMGWSDDQWKTTFQSRLGRQEWLAPYTDETLREIAQRGVKTVLVATPGFTADCLETIDEIGREGLEEFRDAGGDTLIRVDCVNDSPPFIDALKQLVQQETLGWT